MRAPVILAAMGAAGLVAHALIRAIRQARVRKALDLGL